MENGLVSKSFEELFKKYNPLNSTEVSLRDALTLSRYEGIMEERTRILMWIEENRSALELTDDVTIYRDHFDSDRLIDFIKENWNE
jgi:hypothetical protein